MGKGAIIIGIVMILFGFYWVYEVLSDPEIPNFLLIHLSFFIAIGIGLIVFFKAENKIEERKDIKKKS
tara:strand:+ start:367 stop:570 length:204 start_codon:yes stop_codon:yes gene_type:complete